MRPFFGIVLLLSAAAIVPDEAHAQRFEAGASVGAACRGNEASICGPFDRTLIAGHGSWWPSTHLETQVRVARTGLPDIRSDFTVWPDAGAPDGTPTSGRRDTLDRSRTLITIGALYHFGDTRVRWFAGGGLGWRRDREVRSCVPAGCEALPNYLSGGLGEHTFTEGNLAGSVGMSARVTKALLVRGGLTFHNFGGESTATTELSLGVGVRF